MLTDPRISILVARRAVESYKTFHILREVSRNPVKDNGYAVLVKDIDHELEVSRCSESGCNGIVTGYLIAPGIIQRVLQDRHELDMCIVHLPAVIGKVDCKLPVCEEITVRMSSP